MQFDQALYSFKHNQSSDDDNTRLPTTNFIKKGQFSQPYLHSYNLDLVHKITGLYPNVHCRRRSIWHLPRFHVCYVLNAKPLTRTKHDARLIVWNTFRSRVQEGRLDYVVYLANRIFRQEQLVGSVCHGCLPTFADAFALFGHQEFVTCSILGDFSKDSCWFQGRLAVVPGQRK